LPFGTLIAEMLERPGHLVSPRSAMSRPADAPDLSTGKEKAFS
jgi:hypothetical protein